MVWTISLERRVAGGHTYFLIAMVVAKVAAAMRVAVEEDWVLLVHGALVTQGLLAFGRQRAVEPGVVEISTCNKGACVPNNAVGSTEGKTD